MLDFSLTFPGSHVFVTGSNELDGFGIHAYGGSSKNSATTVVGRYGVRFAAYIASAQTIAKSDDFPLDNSQRSLSSSQMKTPMKALCWRREMLVVQRQVSLKLSLEIIENFSDLH
ncbi:hypothetical protein Vi05172_g8009 [Venturia inaequalis]|nr:hypothetical protein Vi05172_g8009 [Venturia inaequalis]